jgi:hypothetical protein
MHFDPVTARLRRRPRRLPSERLAEALLVMAGGHARIARQSEANWASVTFAGTRHCFDLVFEGEAAIEMGEDFIDDLADHEFEIPGQLVADAEVTKVDHRPAPPLMKITCELLLVEEG